MSDERRVPAAATSATVCAVLTCALAFVQGAFGQNASARKDFVKRLAQSTIVTRKGNELVPTYNLSVAGPDSAYFVYHTSLMNPSICRSMLTDGFVSKFHALGFTRLVCTDDGGATFTFDPIVQTVSPVVARRDYAEMVRRSVLKQMGARAPSGYDLSADGPEATIFV